MKEVKDDRTVWAANLGKVAAPADLQPSRIILGNYVNDNDTSP